MATTIAGAWTTWVTPPGSLYSRRMRLVCSVDVPQAMPGATKVVVTGRIVLELQGQPALQDPSTTFTTSGGLLGVTSAAKSISVSSSASQTMLVIERSVSLKSTPQGLTIGAALAGAEAMGVSPAVLTGTVTIPAALPASAALPAAPNSVSRSRVSDTNHTVSYSVTSTTVAPVEKVRIWRQSFLGGQVLIGEPKWTAATGTATGGITDKGTAGGGRYRWGVATVNRHGQSTITWSAWIKTTPSSPLLARLERSGSQVTGAWSRGAYMPGMDLSSLWDRQEIRYQYDSDTAAWTGWTSLGSQVTTHTWTPTNPRVRFEVRAVTTEGVTLYSTAARSPWITALTNPRKPRWTGPDRPQLVGTVLLKWIHQPVDGTRQTAFELRWRVDGGGWTTVTGTTTPIAAVNLPAGEIEAQVRTRGDYVGYSDWSDPLTFVVAYPPTVQIVSPTPGVLTDVNRLTVELAYADPAGAPMVSAEVQLVRSGAVLETKVVSGAATSVTLAERLRNTDTYTVSARVVSGYGLESEWASATFTSSFTTPARPGIGAAIWTEELGVTDISLLAGEATEEQLLPNVDGADQDWVQSLVDWTPGAILLGGMPPGSEYGIGLEGDQIPATPKQVRIAHLVDITPGAIYRGSVHLVLYGSGSLQWRWHMLTKPRVNDGSLTETVGPATSLASGVQTWEWTAGPDDEQAYVYIDVWGTVPADTFLAIGKATLTRLNPGAMGDHVRLERSLDGGQTWDTLADRLPPLGAFTDWTVPLNLLPPALYRPVAVSVVGVEAVGREVEVETPSQAVWLNADDGTSVAIELELGIPADFGQDVVFEEYFGRDVATAHFGPARSTSIQVQGTVIERSMERALLGFQRRTFWYRDPVGRAFRAALDAQLNIGWTSQAGAVSMTVREVANAD